LEKTEDRMREINYLTPDELMGKYGNIKESLFWDVRFIGILFRKGLLIGKPDSHEKKTLIREDTFLMLLKFHDHLKELSKANLDYSTIEGLFLNLN